MLTRHLLLLDFVHCLLHYHPDIPRYRLMFLFLQLPMTTTQYFLLHKFLYPLQKYSVSEFQWAEQGRTCQNKYIHYYLPLAIQYHLRRLFQCRFPLRLYFHQKYRCMEKFHPRHLSGYRKSRQNTKSEWHQ